MLVSIINHYVSNVKTNTMHKCNNVKNNIQQNS